MFSYHSIQELVDFANRKNQTLSELCLEEQAEQMHISPKEVLQKMEVAFDVMVEAVRIGENPDFRSTSGISGGDGAKMIQYADSAETLCGDFVTRAMGRAMAVSNCNAGMGRVVAAPTAGSCGILPSVLVSLYEDRKIEKNKIIMSMVTAGALGMVMAKMASISGAEGGCQAECGSASGMAAAAIVEILGGTPQQVADSMGMAIIQQMGLVCDPVAGLVEIPCIKRNSSGVMIAFCAASMALAGVPLYIPVDECIAAMKEVGESIPVALRETSQGGLATTPTGQRIREQVFGKKKK